MVKKLPKKVDEDIVNQSKFAKIMDKSRDWVVPVAKGVKDSNVQYDSNDWKVIKGNEVQYQGFTVFAAVDPYTAQQRREFRSANSNGYVYRSNRIHTSFTCGGGYTTRATPRLEEELPEEQLEAWTTTTILKVPYWDNQEKTPEEIKDWVDNLCKKKLKLATNIFNAEYNALEQGRCVLAITPLAKDENDKWQMPEMLKLIRPEFTMRPLLDMKTGELLGCQAVGIRSNKRDNTIPAERMVYIMHAFNNELFSDYYGDSKVARVSDIANTLNLILNQTYPKYARNRWHNPRVYTLPVPPQEAGNEETIVAEFSKQVNSAEGKDIVITGPSNKDDLPVQVLYAPSQADSAGLETMRMGLIKAILTSYGIPGFMLSEGDFGSLGGDANLQEIDTYLNTEVSPDRDSLDEVITNQLYDRILAILFDVDDYEKLPMKILHRFNKPKLFTIMPPAMYEQLLDMATRPLGLDGHTLIDEQGLREALGLNDLDREKMSEGAEAQPTTQPWDNTWKSPIQINMWPDKQGGLKTTMSPWGRLPKNWPPVRGDAEK